MSIHEHEWNDEKLNDLKISLQISAYTEHSKLGDWIK